MNQFQTFFKDGKCEEIKIGNTKFNRFDLLAAACKASYDNEELAWEIMHIASRMFHPQDDITFNELYGAVATKIVSNNLETESSIYPRFKKSIKSLFGTNAKILNKKNNSKHQPDSWIRVNGQDIPVEIKLNTFNEKALKQLQRYMRFYKCEKGVAVGSSLSVVLPENIIFISTSELE